MKKNLSIFTILCLSFLLFSVNAQNDPIYQLLNGGFETWYRETSNAGSIVPTGFNSFYSAYTTGLTGIGVAQRCDSSRDVRSGATGIFSLHVYSNSTIGVRANGNVTTGRMYMGSTTALNVNNYNWTDYQTNPPKHCQEITGTPDSMRFWVKYLPGRNGATNTTDKGRIRAYIHGTGECRDAPIYPSGKVETDYYYGKAMKEFFKEDGGWNCYQVPFEYTGNNTLPNTNGNYYVLLSMTTNSTPGGGANNPDLVWFDDIEFIYSAWLTDLKVNGVTIDGFNKNLLTYGGPVLTGTPGELEFPYQPEDFSWTTEVDDIISVVVTNVEGPDGDADGGYTSILITAEDGVTTKEYRIYYFSNFSDDNNIFELSYTLDGETPIAVPGFTPAQQNYLIQLQDPEEVRVPQIREEDVVLSHPAAEIQRIDQPTNVNSTGTVVVKAENYSLQEYNLIFTKAVSSNSKLNWIKVGNEDLSDFDPDVLEYEYSITTCATSIPTVTYEKQSAWANMVYMPATLNNRTATITVTAEDDTQTIYTINFILINDDISFTRFRFSGGNSYDITPVEGETVYERAFSFTSAQTITPTWNCANATVNRVPAATVYYPDTNYFHVTAQDGITTETYKIVLKNTNCFVATGNNSGFRYNYNGLTNQNTAINITAANNNNLNTIITSVVTTPAGPNVPAELVVNGLAASATAAPPTYTIQQPTHRNDTATVTLTANDGVTQKIYRVPFRPTLSTDAALSSITWNGNTIVGFTPANTYYMVALDANVTEVPEIVGIPNFQWLPAENIVVTPAEDLFGTTTIVVTAENGTTTRTYSVEFTVQSSDNAYLSALGYFLGNEQIIVPNFRPTIFNYSVDIPFTTQAPPTLFATPMATGANTFFSYSTPTENSYQGNVLAFSENMAGMKIYTVTFNKVKNTNALLADIQINGISLEDFNPEIFAIDFELSYTELEAPVVTATPAYEFANVEVTQINTVSGTATIYVTAEDDNYEEVYTIDFTRELSPVTMVSNISYEYNDETFTYYLNEEETEVTIFLPVETIGIPEITEVALADFRADYEIDEQPDISNDLTGIITVTAENETEEIYTIIFERTLSESTLLLDISYDGNSIPNFDPNIITYYIILPWNHTQIPNVTATAAWENTSVAIINPTAVFGQATVTVTSEDGQNIKVYTIHFQRQGNARLTALSYNLDGEIIPVPGFDPAMLVYYVTLDMATDAVPVLEYILTDDRCDVYLTQQTEPNGTSELKIVTWNQDDSLTYMVNFTVALSTEAILLDLLVDGITVPNFSANILNYIFDEYEFGTEDLPVVTAVAHYPDADVVIEDISAFPGIATVTVTAGNPSFVNVYTISFSVETGDNNYLTDLTVGGESVPGFNKNVKNYKWDLPFGSTEFPEVAATAEDNRATIDYEQASFPAQTATVTVTALNGDVAEYQVLFVIAKNDNAFAKMIYVDWDSLPNFNSHTTYYNYTLPATYVGEPRIYAETEDPNATVSPVAWVSLTMALVTITAENGETKLEYRINFNKENGIEVYDNETQILVFPNPTSDVLHFVIDEKIQASYVEIYSLENKKVGNFILQNGDNRINIEYLSKGIYFYKIFTDKTMLGAGKIIKN